MAKRPQIGSALEPGNVPRLFVQPAATPVMPFVGPGPKQTLPTEQLSAALFQLAPKFAAAGQAVAEKEAQEDAVDAQTEIKDWTDQLVGYSKEEADAFFLAKYEQGELSKYDDPDAEKARAAMMGAREAYWAQEEWFKLKDSGAFLNTEDEEGSIVPGKDPREEWNRLSQSRNDTYGLSTVEGKAAFNRATANFQAQMNYSIREDAAANRNAQAVNATRAPLFSTFSSIANEVIKADPDQGMLSKQSMSIAAVYDDLKRMKLPDWAERGDQAVLAELGRIRATLNDDGQTLDVFDQVLLTPIGEKGKLLRDNPHFRNAAKEFELSVRKGDELQEAREEKDRDKQNTTAANKHRAAMALAYEEGQARFGDDPGGFLDWLEEKNDELRRQAVDDGADLEMAGYVALAGRGWMEQARRDISGEVAELPGTEQQLFSTLGLAVKAGEADEWMSDVEAMREAGQLSKGTYDSLKSAYENAVKPLRILERDRTWNGIAGEFDKGRAESFKYLTLGDESARVDELDELQQEYQQLALSHVDGDTVDVAELTKLRTTLKNKIQEIDRAAYQKEASNSEAMQALIARAATEDDIKSAFPGQESDLLVQSTIRQSQNEWGKIETYIDGRTERWTPQMKLLSDVLTLRGEAPEDIAQQVIDYNDERRKLLRDVARKGENIEQKKIDIRTAEDALMASIKERTQTTDDEAVKSAERTRAIRLNSFQNAAAIAGHGSTVYPTHDSITATSELWGSASLANKATPVPDEISSLNSAVWDAPFFSGRYKATASSDRSLLMAGQATKFQLLKFANENAWSDKTLGEATLSWMAPNGLSLKELYEQKVQLNDSPPPWEERSGYEPIEATFDGRMAPVPAIPITDLLILTKDARDAGKDVRSAQNAWFNRNEDKLREILGRTMAVKETDFDSFVTLQRQMANKVSEYVYRGK